MHKKPAGILIITILDFLLGFYLGINTLQWQASRNSWKEIIIYDWSLLIFCFIVIVLPFVLAGILTLKLNPLGRKLNISFLAGIGLLCSIYLLKVDFLNGPPVSVLVIILISIAAIFYLTRKNIKAKFMKV